MTGEAPGLDVGQPDPGLAAALNAWYADPTPSAEGRVHAALLGSRLLLAVVLQPGADGPQTVRPTLLGADGRPATPAFTAADPLARWRPDARPVPAAAAEVFGTAAAAGEAVVLDVAGPVPFVLDGAVLRSLAAGYLPVVGDAELSTRPVEGGLTAVVEPYAEASPDLRGELATILALEPLVTEAYLLGAEPGPDASDAAVGLVLAEDVTPAELVALVRRIADALGPAPTLRTGLDIAVLTAEQRAAAAELGPPAYVARQRA